jgi:hypothetical protein
MHNFSVGTNHEGAAASRLPSRIGENQAPSAATIKWRPRTLRLGKTVGNHINGRWIDSQSAVASFHLNAFRLRRGLFYTALPRANPIRTAINGRCRNCWRNRHRNIVDIVQLLAAGQLIYLPGISGFATPAEWATKRMTDRIWSGTILASSRAKMPQGFPETSVESESPASNRVASTFQKSAKRQR